MRKYFQFAEVGSFCEHNYEFVSKNMDKLNKHLVNSSCQNRKCEIYPPPNLREVSVNKSTTNESCINDKSLGISQSERRVVSSLRVYLGKVAPNQKGRRQK